MSNPPLTDEIAREVALIWKSTFSDATLFPGIGLPSENNGVIFLTHTLQLGKVLKITGLPSSSPVAANSLYSAENINGKTLNIYECQPPDIPGLNGEDSTAQVYVKALRAEGLIVSGSHSHWTSQSFFDGEVRDHNVPAIHHQEYNMDPREFSRRTTRALLVLVNEIKRRVGTVEPDFIDDSTCCINNRYAEKILRIWQKEFPDAFILPVIGFPSNNNNKVAVFSHTDGSGHNMTINGLPSKSPLANNALYSFECTRDKFLNLYEIMIPDIPGEEGERSTAQIYVNALAAEGLDVSGVHWHFFGGIMDANDRGAFAIHHQNIGLNPKEFTRATIRALRIVFEVINERGHHSMGHVKSTKSTKPIKSIEQVRSTKSIKQTRSIKSNPREIHDHEFNF